MHERTQSGRWAEQCVLSYLKKNKYQLCHQNYFSKQGEIDLIVRKGNMLVFVEVKMRTASYFDLSEVITYAKQKKIIATAKHYTMFLQNDEILCRFDVALVELKEGKPEITYIEDAFQEHA